MNSSQELLDHLSRNSAPYEDPLLRVEWEALSLDDFWIPEPAISLYGTPEYDRLSDALKRRLSQYEFIYFISGALWLEGLFMERIARISMHSADRLDRLNYRLHELREEAGHSLMFIEFMRRSGLELPLRRFPKPRMATLVGRFAPFESAVFWIAVMIGEEVPDRMNRLIRRHRETISPTVHDVVTTHMIDEARHMAHARDTLEQHMETLPNWQKMLYRPLMRRVFRQFVHAFYYPTQDIYQLAGLPEGPDYCRVARNNPQRAAFIDDCVDPALQLLREQGLVLHWR
ncbi:MULTISPECIES: diiron oxygenase [unclassified Thioalkalivibrio]|uniref:diiron oxygenase n=1 Tax=unclassified Thioalkalivibrio TaxID=2621013 RepID=UPI00037108C5|nr:MULTISPECIES: diiron oxygenase [unclassified Thioalkalivibrio]